MAVEISCLAEQFFLRMSGRESVPYLAVRMWVAGAHHGAAIFKDLHMMNLRHCPQFLKLLRPGTDHALDIFWPHGGKCEVVARREADHAANSGFSLGHNQSTVFKINAVVRNGRHESSEVIVENERA